MAVKISESTNIDKVQVQEQGTADVSGTPSSGYGWYYSGTAGIPYYKNDAGTQFDLSVTMANDTLWNAKGDIVYATGSGAGTVLPIGSASYYLTTDGTVPSWSTGGSTIIIQNVTTTVVTEDPDVGAGEGSFYNGSGKPKFKDGDTGTTYLLAGRQTVFTHSGDVETGTGALKIPNKLGMTLAISGVYLMVGTAPTGAAIIVDIHKDGTTIFTTQGNRPQIAAGATSGNSTSIDVTSWADGEYLTMDIDQIGSGTAGANLTVVVVTS